jgi:reactive intermediate/imine deaminase
MTTFSSIHSKQAPTPIGPYSQAIRLGELLFCSGQVGLDPNSGELKQGVQAQIEQIFDNLQSVAEAGGTSLAKALKLTIFLTDLAHFNIVNDTMSKRFTAPYPARSTIQVSALPRGALVEVEAILVIN